jgi:hypothetical protein
VPRSQRPDGSHLDATALESDCFWQWALIETLRLTDCRIEEAIETHPSVAPSTTPALDQAHVLTDRSNVNRRSGGESTALSSSGRSRHGGYRSPSLSGFDR